MKLAIYLKQANLTPAAFAEQIDTAEMTVYRYLNASRRPAQDILARIAAATGGQVTANDFYDTAIPPAAPAAVGEGEAAS